MISFSSLRKYLILILPFLFLIIGITFNRAKFINDPDYIYIVNALAICNGNSVGHVDNPGTTVMQIGAVTFKIMHLFSNPDHQTLIDHVISTPDKFANGLHIVFVILNSAVLLFLGLFAIKKTKSVWTALLLQISFFLSVNVLDHVWSKVSPEPLLFFVVGVYVITILFYYSEPNKNSWKYTLLFALIVGAGLGTKATFLPLSIFPLMVLPTIKKKIIYFLAIIPSFVLFTIPAIPEYKGMYFWFRNLINHSGIYGQGESKIIVLKNYIPDLVSIFQNNPSLTITIIVGIIITVVTILFGKYSNQNWNLKFLIGLLTTLLLGILLVAKHYGANHYLLPELLLIGITIVFIINVFTDIFQNQKIGHFITPIIVIILIIILPLNHTTKLHQTSKNYGLSSQEIENTNAMIKGEYPDHTIINYYSFSLNKFTALKFGDIYAKGRIRPYLKNKYPNTFFYDFHNNQFLKWDEEIQLSDIIKHNTNRVLLLNGPADEQTLNEMDERGFPLTQIYKGNVQNIFELNTIIYNSLNVDSNDTIIDYFGAENVTSDGLEFLSYNNKKVGSSAAKTNDDSRSGIYAIKLDSNIQFAIEYKIDSLIPNEIYEIEVWRKTTDSPAFLVISSQNQEDFYKAINNGIEKDQNGWELIRARFEITKEMSIQPLFIYFWNPHNNSAYFDDLVIKKLKYNPIH